MNLGTDPRKGDQMVRGVTVLPHGTGRAVRVGVFAQGEAAEAARQAGALALIMRRDRPSTTDGGVELYAEARCATS